MDDDGVRRRAGDEPRGFLPRAWAAGPPAWRRAVDWIFGDREAVDQQGLLAERNLFPRPPRAPRPPGGAGSEPSAPPRDDTER
jgi:hypothetical protein